MTRLEAMLRCDGVFVGAHRGYSSVYPENTLLAVWEALVLGVDLVEVDVFLSRDGVPVLAHDYRLERCTNQTGFISDYTLSELKRMDFGFRKGKQFMGLSLPTLEEFLDLVDEFPQTLITIDFKIWSGVMETVKAVMPVMGKRNCMDRAVFNSIDCAVVSYICDMYGKRTVGAPEFFPSIVNFKEGRDGTFSKLWGICVPMRYLTRELADRYRDIGIAVLCTPADTQAEVDHAISCGVTLPLCNDPRNYLKALGRYSSL